MHMWKIQYNHNLVSQDQNKNKISKRNQHLNNHQVCETSYKEINNSPR